VVVAFCQILISACGARNFASCFPVARPWHVMPYPLALRNFGLHARALRQAKKRAAAPGSYAPLRSALLEFFGPKMVKCLLNSARLRASASFRRRAPEWRAETGRAARLSDVSYLRAFIVPRMPGIGKALRNDIARTAPQGARRSSLPLIKQDGLTSA
jgi:hypothetical protein